MEVFHLTHPHQLKENEIAPTAMALGFFDGIHLGHQQVIGTAKSVADEKGFKSAVMTFDPHPAVVLGKVEHPAYLTPLAEKERLIAELGIDRLYVVRFDQHFSGLDPQVFVDEYIVGLSVKHAVAGFDFTYGHKGKGTMKTIEEHAYGRFDITVIGKIMENGEKISSTAIRKLLSKGKVAEVPTYLGRYYEVKGTVGSGEKRGRTIGFPTANIDTSEDVLIPGTGVYAVQMKRDGVWLDGVASIGYKPTFHSDFGDKPAVEVYLFDFHEDIYGESVAIRWYTKLRDEEKFDSVDALVEQMNQDTEEAKAYFQSRPTCEG